MKGLMLHPYFTCPLCKSPAGYGYDYPWVTCFKCATYGNSETGEVIGFHKHKDLRALLATPSRTTQRVMPNCP